MNDLSKTTWTEFSNCGMLWFVNRILHVFGWVIVCEYDESDIVTLVYPARTTWFGFPEEVDAEKRRAFIDSVDDKYILED